MFLYQISRNVPREQNFFPGSYQIHCILTRGYDAYKYGCQNAVDILCKSKLCTRVSPSVFYREECRVYCVMITLSFVDECLFVELSDNGINLLGNSIKHMIIIEYKDDFQYSL